MTQQPKAVNVFVTAEQFRLAAKLMYDLQRREPSMTARIGNASIVCAAFALELYFKCLLRIEKKKIKKGHDLLNIFYMLGRRNKRKIGHYFKEHSDHMRRHVEKAYEAEGVPKPTVDLYFALKASRNAFVSIRYLHEIGFLPADTGWIADVVMEGVRHIILTKHRDWENARQTSPLPVPGIRSTFQAH
jgi:HEPN domain-containing protein